MNILRLILLLVSTQYVCARFIAPRGTPLRFVPVAELVVRQDDSGGDGSGDSNSGNVDTSQSTVQQPAQVPPVPQQQQEAITPQQQQPGVGEQQQQQGIVPQQQQQPQTGQHLHEQPQPAQPSNQQQQGSQQQQQQQQQQPQPIQQQPSQIQQSLPQQSIHQPPFQTQAFAQAGTPGTNQQKQSGNGALSGLSNGVSGIFGNFLQPGGSSAGSSAVAGSVPSQGASTGGRADNAVNPVGSGNVIASAGAVAQSPGTAGNTGAACSTQNGQGTCMSMSNGCSGGSFVPGYCAASSEECCVHGSSNPAIADPLQSPNAAVQRPSIAASAAALPQSSAGVYYGACSSTSGQGNCVDISAGCGGGTFVPGRCPVGQNTECCVHYSAGSAASVSLGMSPSSVPPSQGSAGIYSGACSSSNGQGMCVDISAGCGGETFVPGQCPVGQNTECCVPNSAGSGASPGLGTGASPVAPPQSSASVYYGACSSPNGQGNCVDISSGCGGGTFVPGRCPVGQNTECCVPNSAGSGASASPGGLSSSVAPPQSSTSIYSGACSSPNGQGMCVSTANGCNGGFFVPGWCPVGQGTECCVPNTSGNNAGSSLGIASSMRPTSAVSVGTSAGFATTANVGATMPSNSISTTISRSITSTLTASQTTNTASSTSNMYHNTTAQTGTCHSLNPTEGYSGIASISNYGNMGSACNCGGSGGYNNASWQGNSGQNLGVGQGYYSGAVNQKLFGGNLNPQGQPGCGQASNPTFTTSWPHPSTHCLPNPSQFPPTAALPTKCCEKQKIANPTLSPAVPATPFKQPAQTPTMAARTAVLIS